MSATGWKLAKYAVVGGALIGVVGYFGGAHDTTAITHTAVAGTFWGIGVGAGAAKEVGPAFQAGFHAGGGNASYPTLTGANPAAPKPTPKPKKVPNCTPKQLKAAPEACA